MNIITMTFVAPNSACGKARGGSISRSGSVTDEQRSHRPNSAQPFGRQFFFGQTSLLAPHRPRRVCSSLAPRLAEKSLAANVIVVMLMTTKLKNRPARRRPRHLFLELGVWCLVFPSRGMA